MRSRTGPLEEVQLLAAPLTLQVSDPVGAPLLAVPVTMAVKMSGVPSADGDDGAAIKLIDGVALERLMVPATGDVALL